MLWQNIDGKHSHINIIHRFVIDDHFQANTMNIFLNISSVFALHFWLVMAILQLNIIDTNM